MLTIKKNVMKAIIAHAENELPHEACGYLAAKEGLVGVHYEMTNLDKAGDHFTMDPKEQFATVKEMRKRGQHLCAVYHSHPETPARPSEEDIRLAFDPDISYVIISLQTKERIVKSFRINKGEVSPEDMEIVDGEAAKTQSHRTEDAMTTTITADAIKNCRGVGCPMNLVYTKVELAKLTPGQVLEIILDDGAPINNVPGSVLREGHRIIGKQQLEDGTWSLLIEKV
jgi:proteasome lid subunit RPN8/RPN11/TusA-related sulfurtransferase